ncbi:hypothetical protein [Pontibacter pamirensis]|nr:hypothetical protein [Pontibacter pamirensis]
MLTQEKRIIKVPQKLGLTLRQIREELNCSNETLLKNIKRHPAR